MKNMIIRDALVEHNMKQWELADILNINEGTLCRKLRHELPIEEQNNIVQLIKNRK